MAHFDQSELTVLRESIEDDEDDESDSSDLDDKTNSVRKTNKMSSILLHHESIGSLEEITQKRIAA